MKALVSVPKEKISKKRKKTEGQAWNAQPCGKQTLKLLVAIAYGLSMTY
jgi:hypothetical protein